MSLEFKFLYGPEVVAAEQFMPEAQRVNWPFDSLVMYTFDDDVLVGRMGLMSFKVIEGTWAAPDSPPTTAYRMMKQMSALQEYLGDTAANAFVLDEQPEIAAYLERVGFERVPVTLYTRSLIKKDVAA